MAKTNNPIFKGMSGKLGDLVFKLRGGQTFVSQAPKRRKNRILSAKETESRERFALRSQMAKTLLSDPEIAAIYEAARNPMQSAYVIAFRDISHSPEVLNIEAEDYKGSPGEKIFIEAVDDFKVRSVTVTITSADNKIIEQGEAVLHHINIYWIYTVQKRNRKVEGCTIRVNARDIPRNDGSMEVTVNRE